MNSNIHRSGTQFFPASLDRLYDMLRFIRSAVSEVGFDDSTASKIELACEETLVNIISYGFPDETGSIEIDCKPTPLPGIKIRIKDKGIPFNPLNKSKGLKTANNGEENLGGYGIFFILRLMDEVSYKREDPYNILILIKNI